MKKIKLSQNQYALVDDEDFEWLSKWNWHVLLMGTKYYAYRTESRKRMNCKTKEVSMARQIMGFPRDLIVDHINHNSLDNKKSNLRVVTKRQNAQNLINSGKSKYPGVSWCESKKRWRAHIQIKGKMKHLKYCKNEEEAFGYYKKEVELLGDSILGEEDL